MRTLRTRSDAACERAGDSGFTLVETIVTVLLLTLAVVMIALAGTNGLRLQATAERSAIAANAQADILAKARQVDFAELGFYEDQLVGAGSHADLPLTDDTGQPLRETHATLGPLAPDVRPFAVEPVTVFDDDEDRPLVRYRAQTWVTEAPLETTDGVSVTAKRVTVQVEWAPVALEDALDGTCTNPEVRCSVQTIVRAATGADVDVDNESAWATSPCNASNAVGEAVCEAYVRSGRVLDGSTMVSATDLPVQRQPVDLYARTTARADSVVATWTQMVQNPDGTVTPLNRSVELETVDGGTRWAGVVEPDPENASPRGVIRPGSTTVTFSALLDDGSTISTTTTAFWSVGLDTHGSLSIVAGSVAGACTAVGGPVEFTVTGHSAGMRLTGSPAAAADAAKVAFPRTLGSVTDTVTVDAELIAVTPVVELIAGTPVEVASAATWRVSTPATSSCEATRHAAVQVHRAIDRSVTNIPLTLEAP